MRFNKEDLLNLAAQSGHKYEKEGVLVLREKPEGFFRRAQRRNSKGSGLSCVAPNSEAFCDRWFRLAGNLLFYLKTTDHWSEPLGVLVLENCSVSVDQATYPNQPGYHFLIAFNSGPTYWLSASSESERSGWVTAISGASFSAIKTKLESLKSQLETLQTKAAAASEVQIKSSGYVEDLAESPLCDVSLSCDNLRCDSHGRAPNPKIYVHVRTNSPSSHWVKYACTEATQRTSNPVFLTTISFRESDGLSDETEVRFSVYDVRERMTGTQTVVGHLSLLLGALKSVERIRLPITSPIPTAQSHPSTHPGFLSITVWNLEREERTSTESTPCRLTSGNRFDTKNSGSAGQTLMFSHRRTQSLPPRLGTKLKIPLQNNFGLLFSHPFVQTYRFHSGLGGDIFVHEIMAESKLSFLFPQQLLSVWIAEEKELLQEMIGLGELREPWHSRQVDIIERHLWLINLYTQARHNLRRSSGGWDFRQSSTKADCTLEFVPLNLHLQRMWAQNESLHKSGFHDTITVGAFTAYAQGYERGGLVRMLRNWDKTKEEATSKVDMTHHSVQGIKRLRREIVERMQVIMKLAKERKTHGMHRFVQEIYHRCRLLLTICDQSLIEEAFDFLERQKMSPAEYFASTASSGSSNKEMVDEGIVDTPNSPLRSLVDLIKREAKDTGEDNTPDSGVGIEDIVKSFLDSPSSNYYRPSEEPEPWDLTQLNIQASLISLNSKVKVLCGQGAEIESFRSSSQGVLRVHSVHIHTTTPLLSTLNNNGASSGGANWRKSLRSSAESPSMSGNEKQSTTVTSGIINSSGANSNAMTAMTLSEHGDWSEELRSSVKKLRLALDGLLKTSRLAHSIFRLQERNDMGHVLKYRRDICFSHALTSLVVGLMSRLWCRKPDPSFLYVMTRLGPLVSFHCFLTHHGQEAEMFNDMIVAIEDLRTVEFVMIVGSGDGNGGGVGGLPMPKVHGSRSGLKVVLPIPESLFSMLPLDGSRSSSFVVTPVFFNIGINEQASIAELVGNVEPQEKSNMDSFARLNEYYRRFRKLTLPVKFTSKRSQTVEPNVDLLLDKMHEELLSKKKKNVEIIHLSAQITRALMGLRFSSCKSGKDRTSMSVTLEQMQILSQEYDLAEHEFSSALDAMRSEGCRRENTLKNIGQRKYAFNSLQVLALPKAYRPPAGTFGNVQT